MPDYCAQEGKVICRTLGKAEAMLRSLRRRKDYDGHVYPCAYCRGFHVGRRKRQSRHNKYAVNPERK